MVLGDRPPPGPHRQAGDPRQDQGGGLRAGPRGREQRDGGPDVSRGGAADPAGVWRLGRRMTYHRSTTKGTARTGGRRAGLRSPTSMTIAASEPSYSARHRVSPG